MNRITGYFSANVTIDRSTLDDWQRQANAHTVILRYQRRTFSFPYFTGPAVTDPKLADAVFCILMDARYGQESFEEYCDLLGLDPDSRRAERTWKACQDTDRRLRRFLGSDYDAFCDMDEDQLAKRVIEPA